jgi:hypothetical protein
MRIRNPLISYAIMMGASRLIPKVIAVSLRLYGADGDISDDEDFEIYDQEEEHHGHALDPAFSLEWWIDGIVATVCTVISAFMAGLTVGLVGLDKMTLEINATLDPVWKLRAQKIQPVISKHHWMLSTLMLINAIVMETLPIYVDKMVPELIAICICVFLELIAGEVIPMSICSGPSQVKIATIFAHYVM